MSILLGRFGGRESGRRPGARPALWALGAILGCGGLLTAACGGAAPHPTSAGQVAGQTSAGGNGSGDAAGPGTGGGSAPGSGGGSARSRRASGRPHPQPTSARQIAAPQPTTPPVPTCQTSWLRGSVGAPNGAAGTFYYPVELSNVSAAACTLYGYPGVSVVTGPTGSQVGPAATRIPTFGPRLITVAPGQSAHASLQLPDPGDFGPGVCKPATVHWLRVYPPGQGAPLYIAVPASSDPMQICTGTNLHGVIPLGIFAVLSGTTGP
ncbi:MAG: DUF4232 domain-containing protein [Streptosporangiaceae bacterium]